MRIKFVAEADFRWADVGIFKRFAAANAALVAKLQEHDVIAFVARKGNQILFIHGFEQIANARGTPVELLATTRYRLLSGTWNPLMLRNYAEGAGLKIEGLKSFEDYYRKLQEEA